MNRNPCFRCGFYDEDFGCVASSYEPWTVPEDCYLYDEEVVNDMIDFYINNNTKGD